MLRSEIPQRWGALPLTVGQVYIFDAETTGASGVCGFFYIGQNGPIRINVPDLCGSSFVGDVKPVKCGTKQPYVEPTNLEQFVKDHRVD
jgi:hypothetical protein